MLPRLSYDGAVDADGHVLEPPDLRDRELEPRFRDRPLGIRRDGDGLEYLEIAGRPSKMVRRNLPQFLGAMDMIGGIPAPPGRVRTGLGYVDNAGLGAWDATERLERLDRENLDLAILYPTLGVLWEAECEDLELAQAYARVYDRWIVDFCRGSGGWLVPIAHLSLGLPEEAERELERAVRDGVKGVFIAPFVMTRKAPGHPDHHRVFRLAEEAGLPTGRPILGIIADQVPELPSGPLKRNPRPPCVASRGLLDLRSADGSSYTSWRAGRAGPP